MILHSLQMFVVQMVIFLLLGNFASGVRKMAHYVYNFPNYIKFITLREYSSNQIQSRERASYSH